MFRPLATTSVQSGSVLLGVLLLSSGASVFSNSGELSDPTRPPLVAPAGSAAQQALPVLSSVLIGIDRKLAVIDGKVLAEGDVSQGFRVQRIEPDRVVVSRAGRPAVTLLLDRTPIDKDVR